MSTSEKPRLLIRLGELTLKGGARARFEKRLRLNIARALELPKGRIKRLRGRMVATLEAGADAARARQRLSRVFGVHSFAQAACVAPELPAIASACEALARAPAALSATSFRIEARRRDGRFPLSSQELNEQLGGVVLAARPALRVELSAPELCIGVEVFKGEAFVTGGWEPGPGGLPGGSSGDGLLLLSGGIDSPVAGWLMQRRGLALNAVTFHASEFVGDQVLEKVKELCGILGGWSADALHLIVVPVSALQRELIARAPEPLWTLLLRREMLRIADRLAAASGAGALVTGDCLAQVASQTLANLGCLEGVAARPVLRPLIGLDKEQVIDQARALGTYEVSIQPHSDCCEVMAPARPETRADPARLAAVEAGLELAALRERALADLQVWRPEGRALVACEDPSRGLWRRLQATPEATPTPPDTLG